MKFPGAVLLALSRTGMYRHKVAGYEPAEMLGDKVIPSHALPREPLIFLFPVLHIPILHHCAVQAMQSWMWDKKDQVMQK